MKIQCDVCNKDEASVFCTADEAALCSGCDHRVHHANKLASKHQRFSLHRPVSSNQNPLCDVCKEKRAFVFCQQDRAILCKECDFAIHSANEHTKKHNRFLLTGVKLSDSTKLYSSTPSKSINTLLKNGGESSSSMLNSKDDSSSSSCNNNNNLSAPPISGCGNLVGIEGNGSNSASSISEYLIETIPGWQVEDFLDSSFAPLGFSKSGDDMLQVFDADIDGNLGSFSTENVGIWVPQAPPPLYPSQILDHRQIVHVESKDNATTNIKGSNRSRLRDDNFIVPQISPHSNSKRPRFLW